MTGNNGKLIFQEWLNAYGDHLQRLAKPGVAEPSSTAVESQELITPPQMGREGGLDLK